jgi:hypothetical protein
MATVDRQYSARLGATGRRNTVDLIMRGLSRCNFGETLTAGPA